MNTDITFCENQSCRIRKYCRRGVDIKTETVLLTATQYYDCLHERDSFFIDNQLPIIVYESNPKEVIEFGEWLRKEVNCNENWTLNYLGNTKTTEELYKIYKDGNKN